MEMNSFLFTIFVIGVTIIGCNNLPVNNAETKDKIMIPTPPASPNNHLEIGWVDSSQCSVVIDPSLSYKSKMIKCDSALAIDYIGYKGEHTFLPINVFGQWINTIKKVKKLSRKQEQYLTSIIGDKSTYQNPLLVACYEPRLAIVYFKNGEVIGITAICLACARLESTIKIGDPKQEGLINEHGRKGLSKLCVELQFSDL